MSKLLKDFTRDEFTQWLEEELIDCLFGDSRSLIHHRHEIYMRIRKEGIPEEILDEIPNLSDAVSSIVDEVVAELMDNWSFRKNLEEAINEDFFGDLESCNDQLEMRDINLFLEMNLSDDEITSLKQAPRKVRKFWSDCCDHLGMSENDDRRGFFNKHTTIDELIEAYVENNRLEQPAAS